MNCHLVEGTGFPKTILQAKLRDSPALTVIVVESGACIQGLTAIYMNYVTLIQMLVF